MKSRPLPPAADLWERYSYNPLTGEIYSRRRPGYGPLGCFNGRYKQIHHNTAEHHQLIHNHRLIWKWVTGRDPQHTIDHINRDKADNRFWNLRDVGMDIQNQNNSGTVLTPDAVRSIRAALAKGQQTQRQIANDHGICASNITEIKNGKIWANVS